MVYQLYEGISIIRGHINYTKVFPVLLIAIKNVVGQGS